MSTTYLPRILYVDTDGPSRDFFTKWLTRNAPSFDVVCADGASEALEKIAAVPFDLYVFEYCLGEMTGPELCRLIRHHDTQTPVVICSPLSREIDRNTAFSAGATSYVVKPDDLGTLSRIMRSFLAHGDKPRRPQPLRRSSAII
jgi:two-component system, OmpR family, phosphate regulon response regulator PhoB